MNRRGFLAFLAAAPVAGMEGLRPQKPLTFARVWDAVKHFRTPAKGPTMTTYQWSRVVGESTSRMVDEMSACGEEMGSSYNFLKSREASKIMARVDRDHLKSLK